ncbi:MAG: ATP-binding protein [Micavibrio sp.]|nr:ATP-binding protein [Micavibrio sp.]
MTEHVYSRGKVKDVLVIDDDATDRMAIRRALSRPPHEINVFEAATGDEAARMLSERGFDCIFLDYRLPDMDGITFLKRFYDIDTDLAPSPVVMLTGQGSEGVMTDALRWGAHDYIIKDNISADSIVIALAKAREIYELRLNRMHAEEKLRHAQKMDAVGQLTSGIAHDFNNLLTVILGNTHLLMRKMQNLSNAEATAMISPKVEAIETAARKGADLVRHLMVFTRQRELKEEIIVLNSCINSTIGLLRRTLGERVEIDAKLAEDTWPVCIDVNLFENALINIAVNARDAMPKGGKIWISTQNVNVDDEYTRVHPDMSADNYVMVSISDSGTGMPEEVRQRIFEPFYTTKPAGEGTGLGLSMVYGFIKQSGGHVQVESELGQGTTFHIYLPRHTSPAANV